MARYRAIWWSLTPPFHPYHKCGGLLSVALAEGHPSRTLSGVLPYEAQTFLSKLAFAAVACPALAWGSVAKKSPSA